MISGLLAYRKIRQSCNVEYRNLTRWRWLWWGYEIISFGICGLLRFVSSIFTILQVAFCHIWHFSSFGAMRPNFYSQILLDLLLKFSYSCHCFAQKCRCWIYALLLDRIWKMKDLIRRWSDSLNSLQLCRLSIRSLFLILNDFSAIMAVFRCSFL